MVVVVATCALFLGIAAWGLARPGAALGLVICMFAFDQILPANSEYFVEHSWVTNAAVAASAGLSVAAAMLGGRYRFRSGLRPVFLAAVGYVALFAATAEWTPFASALQVVRTILPYLILQVLAAPLLLNRTDDAYAGLWLALWLCAAATVYVLADESVWSTQPQRLALGLAGQPGQSSNSLALGDVGSTAFILASLTPQFTRWRNLSNVPYYAVCAVALIVAAQASRGETIAAAGAAIVIRILLTATDRERSGGRAAIVLVVIVALGSVAAALQTQFGQRYGPAAMATGVDVRVNLVTAVWERFVDRPGSWLLGLGANFSAAMLGAYPHNHAVQALTETGIVGLTLWAMIPILGLKSIFRVRHLVTNDPRQRFSFACLTALLIYYLLLSFKRGAVLDAPLFMYSVLADRFALAVLDEQSPERADLAPESVPQARTV